MMKVDISQDDALMGLDDLVEYEPTTVTASPQSENLLTRIAGGNYWMDIVRDFQMGRIDGYQAERRLSAEVQICVGHAHQTETWSEAQVPDDTCLRP